MNYYMSSPDSSSAGSFYEQSLSYGSRPESTSPTLSQSSPAYAKLRQEACRGFEAEDDNEFCPALVAIAAPLTAPLAAPVAAAVAASQSTLAPIPISLPQQKDVESVPTVAVQARKALEIIDPATGMPVGRR